MIGDLAINGPAGAALPGMDMQIIMAYLATFLVFSLRIGAFLLSAPFFNALGAFTNPDYYGVYSGRISCAGS